MSRDLTLTVRDNINGVTYTYGNDRLLVDVGAVETKADGLDVRLENIPLSVSQGGASSNEFIGFTDPLALPEHTYRAKLEDASGTVILDGAIVTSDVTFNDELKSWEARIIDQASEDFWIQLDGRFFDISGGSLLKRTFDAYQEEGDRLISAVIDLLQPRSVLKQIFTEIGATHDMPQYLWEYEVEYDKATFSRTSENVYISRGGENDKTMVEEITKLAGWRVRVTYQSFPSLDLHVKMYPTTWKGPNINPQYTLDGEEAPAAYDLSLERSPADWALATREGVNTNSADPRDRKYNYGDIRAFAQPPMWGSYAPTSWTAAPVSTAQLFSGVGSFTSVPVDDREMQVSPVQSSFKVLPMSIEEEETNGAGTETSVFGIPFISNTFDYPLYRQNIRDELFIIESGKDNPNSQLGVYYGLFCRYPTLSEFNPDKDIGHSAAWALAPYQAQTMRRAPLQTAQGEWVDVADAPVGDPATLLELEGEKWQPRESSTGIDDLITEFDLIRPLATDAKPARPQRAPSDWTVLVPRGEYRTITRGNGDEDWFLIHWERTPAEDGEELWYNVEYRDNRVSSPSWTSIGQVGDRTFSTALTHQFKSGGNGGDNINQGNIEARVRPVRGASNAGTWRTFDLIQK